MLVGKAGSVPAAALPWKTHRPVVREPDGRGATAFHGERASIAIALATSPPPPAAVSAIAGAAATAAAGTAFGFRPCFVDVDGGASADLRAVQGRDGLLAVFIAGHLENRSRGIRVAIGHDAHAIHLPVRLKRRSSSSLVLKLRLPTKIFFTRLPLELSEVQAQFGGLGRSGRPENRYRAGGTIRMRRAAV